jgi:DNA-binding CsgD family transcriptional regulator
MTSANPRFNILPLRPRSHRAEQQLDQFQANLVSEALRRAVEDTNAAMAHQLSEPLTALLLYLDEIRQRAGRSGGAETFPGAMCEMVDMALRETERACDIMELVGQNIERPVAGDGAVARGREAIASWTHDSHAGASDRAASRLAPDKERSLTPREHEVLAIIIGGASNKVGGNQLGISRRTFEVHRANLMAKLGARNAADLVRISLDGVQSGLDPVNQSLLNRRGVRSYS